MNTPSQNDKHPNQTQKPEVEFSGPFYKHPYFIYIAITVGLFLFLVVMGILAMNSSSLLPQNS